MILNELIEPGEYEAIIILAEVRESKIGRGYIAVSLKLKDDNRVVIGTLASEQSLKRFDEIFKTNLSWSYRDNPIEIKDLKSLEGLSGKVKVIKSQYKDTEFNAIDWKVNE